MNHFRHGRVLFVGDAAHQVSPLRCARANSGIQDTDNLVWKLKLVMDGKAPPRLLDTYSARARLRGRREPHELHPLHRLHHPKSTTSKTFRNAVLGLAEHYPFARALVNSGRLSVPAYLTDSRLNTPDAESFAGNMVPGAAMDDAPIEAAGGQRWLLRRPATLPAAVFRRRCRRHRCCHRAGAGLAGRSADSGRAIVVQLAGTAPAGCSRCVDTRGHRRALRPARGTTT